MKWTLECGAEASDNTKHLVMGLNCFGQSDSHYIRDMLSEENFNNCFFYREFKKIINLSGKPFNA